MIDGPLVRVVPLLVAITYAFVVVLCWGGGYMVELSALCLGYTLVIIAAYVFTASLVLAHAVWTRDHRGTSPSITSLIRAFLSERWRVDRGLSLWQPMLTFIIMMTAFTFFKQSTLRGAGFGYGPWIAEADRALFGTDPWRITHVVLASPWSTQALDLAYHAWFAPMTLGVAFCAFARPGSILAWRYLATYCLLWILLGSFLAYVFPAAGPIYFASFQHETGRFVGLTQSLASEDAALRAHGAAGLSALRYQQQLLVNFKHGTIMLGGGISAMPSLHNALAVLFACAAGHVSRPLGWLMTGYAGIVWIGSIHLGWH
ncbi:hypothetical protein DBR17_10515 [Sphingomonas sp. HMWF008]|nr:hypothetical protein DBR17_10515 [Sphingomonas sp. HMWF008]